METAQTQVPQNGDNSKVFEESLDKFSKGLYGDWASIFEEFVTNGDIRGSMIERTPYTFSIFPFSSVRGFNNYLSHRKLAALYFWYKTGNNTERFITKYFKEYERCIDEKHQVFNSNYGKFAYADKLLDKCVTRLYNDPHTRHAMFCINNNDSMSDASIDKLCTNTIQFILTKGRELRMIIQMRSSNFISFLPYDSFMFSVFYAHVFLKLIDLGYDIRFGSMYFQIASLHTTFKDLDNLSKCIHDYGQESNEHVDTLGDLSYFYSDAVLKDAHKFNKFFTDLENYLLHILLND